MSIAKKVTPPSSDPGVYADIFIEEMRRETGCSDAFLMDARPALVKLYRDVQGEALETCLDDVRQLIAQQAETERICELAKEDARRLEQTQRQLDSDIRSIHRQVKEIRDTLQATALTMYAMKSPFVGKA
jgi:hypothetical protein